MHFGWLDVCLLVDAFGYNWIYIICHRIPMMGAFGGVGWMLFDALVGCGGCRCELVPFYSGVCRHLSVHITVYVSACFLLHVNVSAVVTQEGKGFSFKRKS